MSIGKLVVDRFTSVRGCWTIQRNLVYVNVLTYLIRKTVHGVKIAAVGDNVVIAISPATRCIQGGTASTWQFMRAVLARNRLISGRSGNDKAGDLIKDALAAEGVDLARLRRAR